MVYERSIGLDVTKSPAVLLYCLILPYIYIYMGICIPYSSFICLVFPLFHSYFNTTGHLFTSTDSGRPVNTRCKQLSFKMILWLVAFYDFYDKGVSQSLWC